MGIKANGKSRHGGFSVTAIRKIITRDVQIRQLFSAPKAHLRRALRLSHQFRQLGDVRSNPPRLVFGEQLGGCPARFGSHLFRSYKIIAVSISHLYTDKITLEPDSIEQLLCGIQNLIFKLRMTTSPAFLCRKPRKTE
jgi:hypothetical protein